jgi:hypothetical protein
MLKVIHPSDKPNLDIVSLDENNNIRIGEPINKNTNNVIVPTKIIDNFFTDSEVNYLLSLLEKYPEQNGKTIGTDPQLPYDMLEREVLAFGDEPEFESAVAMMRQKIDRWFGPEVIIGGWHILTSYFPYRAHTDALFGEYGFDENNYAAWTLVIPLDDYDSHTILFDQYSFQTKLVPEYVKTHEPLDIIDEYTYNKYLSLEALESMRYFSIDSIYKWKKAKCFAASRYKFHASDNFINNGITMKRGIVVWTAAPNGFLPK